MKPITSKASLTTVFIVVLACMGIVFPQSAPAKYSVTDLGVPGVSSAAATINERGQVVGLFYTPTGESHACLWQHGTMTDLGTMGWSNSVANAINSRGQIAGTMDTIFCEEICMGGDCWQECYGDYHTFLWQDGVMTDLGGDEYWVPNINNRGQVVGVADRAYVWRDGIKTHLGSLGGVGTYAYAINEHGQIVGSSATESGETHPFLWQRGIMTDLAPPDVWDGMALAINQDGQVVGTYYSSSCPYQCGFLWQDGKWTDLGSLGGEYKYAVALAINNSGRIVGVSGTASGEDHAFLWQDGVMTDLGTLGGGWSAAKAINNRGQIVGQSGTASGENHAFLWQRGTMTDLGTLGGGWSEVSVINENGQIAGTSAISETEWHAVVWTKGR